MPISGVVISTVPKQKPAVLKTLQGMGGVEIHGDDDRGNIVAVLDTGCSEDMEQLIDDINALQHVLQVGVTYLNTEDEAERMAAGERVPRPFGFKGSLGG